MRVCKKQGEEESGFACRDMAVRLGKTMKAFSIIWEVDEGDDVCLPSEVEIPADIDPDDEERISDYLSDLTGFCHKGFCLDA